MSKVNLRPAREGLKVPFPMSKRFLSESGEMVEKSSYWIRRMKDGDVVEVKETKAKAPSTKSKAKTTKKLEDES